MHTSLLTPWSLRSGSFEILLQDNPQLNDPATLQGMAALVEQLAPLLQGKRFHNLVDLLSASSDVVDMTDDAMVQKMMNGYENVVAGAFNLNNVMRSPACRPVPRRIRPPRDSRCADSTAMPMPPRRGLAMTLAMLGLLGRQARHDAAMPPEG